MNIRRLAEIAEELNAPGLAQSLIDTLTEIRELAVHDRTFGERTIQQREINAIQDDLVAITEH